MRYAEAQRARKKLERAPWLAGLSQNDRPRFRVRHVTGELRPHKTKGFPRWRRNPRGWIIQVKTQVTDHFGNPVWAEVIFWNGEHAH